MVRIYDMRQKEVINIKDGSRYGFISDIEVNTKSGIIESIIVPGPGKILGVFGREQEYRIEWNHIKHIGEDIILVDVKTENVLKEC